MTEDKNEVEEGRGKNKKRGDGRNRLIMGRHLGRGQVKEGVAQRQDVWKKVERREGRVEERGGKSGESA